MKKLMLIALMVLLAVPGVMGSQTDEVKQFAEKKISVVIGLLKDKSLSKEVRDKKIIATVNPLLDFDRMAKISLGKEGWTGMNDAQQKKFLDLFVKQLQTSYLQKLDLYTDEEVEVEHAKQVKNRIHVTTLLVSKTDKMEMVYKFYKSKKKGWMVYDVVILGVSVVQTYRSQFSNLLKEGGYDNLFKKLETMAVNIQTPNKK